MEEPENGIHPGRMKAMVDLVRSLAVDPAEPPSPENPLRQVLVNTHSPFFVQYQYPDDLLLAMPTKVRRGENFVTTMRLLPLAGTWRSRNHRRAVSLETIVDYLIEPEEAQLKLDFGGAA